MALCCSGRATGAIQGIKYGKPLRENFERGKVHNYLDTLGKLIVKDKDVISYPITVETKDLDKLRKVLQKPSDGLVISNLKVDGEIALAAVKDVLEQLPTPLLAKDSVALATWTRASTILHVSESTADAIQDPDEHETGVKALQNVLGHLDAADFLMLKYVVALIRILSQHPEKDILRPRHQAELTRYFVESLVYKKAKTPELEKSERALNFLVRYSEEVFEAQVEDLLVPVRPMEPTAVEVESKTAPPDSWVKMDENVELKLKSIVSIEVDEIEAESGVDMTSVRDDLSRMSSHESRKSMSSRKDKSSSRRRSSSKKSLDRSSIWSKSKLRKPSKEPPLMDSESSRLLMPYPKSSDQVDIERLIPPVPSSVSDRLSPVPMEQRSYIVSTVPKMTEPKGGVSTPEAQLPPLSTASLVPPVMPQTRSSSPDTQRRIPVSEHTIRPPTPTQEEEELLLDEQRDDVLSLKSIKSLKSLLSEKKPQPVAPSPTKVSIRGLPLDDPRLTENDLWDYLVLNMENQIKEAQAILNNGFLYRVVPATGGLE